MVHQNKTFAEEIIMFDAESHRLKVQVDILVTEIANLKASYKELKRKYNSLTLWNLLRGKHK